MHFIKKRQSSICKKIANSTSILAHSLDFCACIISDPIYRFKTGYGSKLLSTLGQHEDDSGSSSFIAFDLENTLELIASIETKKLFPIIVKPIDGSIDTRGGLHLIEANSSPNWKAFQQSTGIDVAAVIIQVIER